MGKTIAKVHDNLQSGPKKVNISHNLNLMSQWLLFTAKCKTKEVR